jgi:hypothetical protein
MLSSSVPFYKPTDFASFSSLVTRHLSLPFGPFGKSQTPKNRGLRQTPVRSEICTRTPPPESRLIFFLDSDIHLIVYLLVALLI